MFNQISLTRRNSSFFLVMLALIAGTSCKLNNNSSSEAKALAPPSSDATDADAANGLKCERNSSGGYLAVSTTTGQQFSKFNWSQDNHAECVNYIHQEPENGLACQQTGPDTYAAISIATGKQFSGGQNSHDECIKYKRTEPVNGVICVAASGSYQAIVINTGQSVGHYSLGRDNLSDCKAAISATPVAP